MRSLKSGLFAIAFTGLVGAAAVVGCSADGGGSGVDDGHPGARPRRGLLGRLVLPPR